MCTCPSQLADIRDSWQAGMVVIPADIRAVAHKFIVPNLLSHLSAMLERLFCEPTARLTFDYTYGDLFRAWSLDPADHNSRQQFELLLQQIDDEEEWGLPEFACWWCIEQTLVFEAYVLQLRIATHWPQSIAWQVLAEELPPENYLRPSKELNRLQIEEMRKRHFAPTLDKWFHEGGLWLRDVLTDLMSDLLLRPNFRQVIIQIRDALAKISKTFLDQTIYLAEQRGELLENLRRRSLSAHKLLLPEPLNEGWFQKISAELMMNFKARRGMNWHGENLHQLRILLHWIDACDLEGGRPRANAN